MIFIEGHLVNTIPVNENPFTTNPFTNLYAHGHPSKPCVIYSPANRYVDARIGGYMAGITCYAYLIAAGQAAKAGRVNRMSCGCNGSNVNG